MATLKVTHSISGLGSPWSQDVEKTASLGQTVDESIPDSTTDQLVNWTCDISVASIVVFWSDQAITIETNSGSSPQETITLGANYPLIWVRGEAGETSPFAGDITGLYVTNNSGSTATFRIRSVEDATV